MDEVKMFKNSTYVTISLILTSAVFLGGCAPRSHEVSENVEMGEFPDRDQAVVFSADGKDDADSYTMAKEELTEAEWEVLERFAPRNVWERIRDKSKRLRELKKKVKQAQSEKMQPTSMPEISKARVEEIGDDRIVMYYRVRYFGGLGIKALNNGGTDRLRIKTDPKHHEKKLTELVKLVQKRIGKEVTVDLLAEENTVVIECPKSKKQTVLNMLSHMDVPQPQVEISAEIFEVRHDMDFQAGARLLINHMDLTGNQQGLASNFSAKDFAASASGTFPGNVPDPGSAMRLVQTFGNSGIQAGATIQALASQGFLKMIASPRMTVSMGRTAYMLAGQELPIASAVISNESIVSEKTTYKPIGVQLYVTPQIVSEDSVKLHVVTNVSSVQGFMDLPELEGNTLKNPVTNPILDSREAETYVTVPDGGSLVVGGLRKVHSMTGEEGIPGLMDIPFLGWMFKSHRSQKKITDLYFFVTPRIVSN